MTMAWIWAGMAVISLVYGALSGNLAAVSAAAIDGATGAVTLCLGMCGAICLWCGQIEVMKRAGLMKKLSALLSPALSCLLPESAGDPETMGAVSANVSANLLGLGNAATPMGIKAAARMAKGKTVASDDLCTLTVLNTASIQLIPATVAALRSACGCASPFDILPAVWATSLVSVAAGLSAAKLFARLWRS